MRECVAEIQFNSLQLLLFLKGFTESERNKLAMLTGILLANGNLSASILSSLFNENLVKEGTFFSALEACLVVLFVVSDMCSRSSWSEIAQSYLIRRKILYLFFFPLLLKSCCSIVVKRRIFQSFNTIKVGFFSMSCKI